MMPNSDAEGAPSPRRAQHAQGHILVGGDPEVVAGERDLLVQGVLWILSVVMPLTRAPSQRTMRLELNDQPACPPRAAWRRLSPRIPRREATRVGALAMA